MKTKKDNNSGLYDHFITLLYAMFAIISMRAFSRMFSGRREVPPAQEEPLTQLQASSTRNILATIRPFRSLTSSVLLLSFVQSTFSQTQFFLTPANMTGFKNLLRIVAHSGRHHDKVVQAIVTQLPEQFGVVVTQLNGTHGTFTEIPLDLIVKLTNVTSLALNNEFLQQSPYFLIQAITFFVQKLSRDIHWNTVKPIVLGVMIPVATIILVGAVVSIMCMGSASCGKRAKALTQCGSRTRSRSDLESVLLEVSADEGENNNNNNNNDISEIGFQSLRKL